MSTEPTPEEIAAAESLVEPMVYGQGGDAWEQMPSIKDIALRLRETQSALRAELAQAREDSARLDWLIKQGPPNASEGNWLTNETWELATMFANDDKNDADKRAIRAAIDFARKPSA